MRMPSRKVFANTVLFQTVSSAADTSGDSGQKTYSAGTVLIASVQPLSAQRVVAHGQEEQLVSHQVLFPSPPVDTSAGKRAPGDCRVMDRIVWTPPSGPAMTLHALGPALDQAGRGVMWVVNCEARS